MVVIVASVEQDSVPQRQRRPAPEPLWREVVGEEVRRARTESAERLVDVAERAGVSPQYLSEIERGIKDPSSEVLSAVAGALGTSVADLARRGYHLASMTPLTTATRTAAPGAQRSEPVCLAA